MCSSSAASYALIQKASVTATNACGRQREKFMPKGGMTTIAAVTGSSSSSSMPPPLFSNGGSFTAAKMTTNTHNTVHFQPVGQSAFFTNDLFTIHEASTTATTSALSQLSIRPPCDTVSPPKCKTTFTWSDLYQEIDNIILSSTPMEEDNATKNTTDSEQHALSSFPSIEWSFDDDDDEEDVEVEASPLASHPRHYHNHHGLVRCRNIPSHLDSLADFNNGAAAVASSSISAR